MYLYTNIYKYKYNLFRFLKIKLIKKKIKTF